MQVCVCADVPWVMQFKVSLCVLYLVSWFHQSVIIPADIRSITLLLKEQKELRSLFGLLLVQTVCVCMCVSVCTCETVTVHEAHTCVYCVDLNVPRITVCVRAYTTFTSLYCVCLCVISTPRAKCILY